MGTIANIEDPDERLHNAAFHLGLHFLQTKFIIGEIYLFEIIICDPSIYTMDHPGLTVSNYGEFHWYKNGLFLSLGSV